MQTLPIADEKRTVTKSSISQRSNTLAVTNNLGAFFPICYDFLDYIDCDRVKAHPSIISTTNELDYEYPVGHCLYYTDNYIYSDEHGVELRVLPHWFGEGFISIAKNKQTFINSDREALGTRIEQEVPIGLHYVEATDTLE